jgi:nicotinamidase-related amidase
MISRLGKLNPQRSILLLCDMQEKFSPSIAYFNDIIETSTRVLDACNLLNVPCIATEQYPKGLGSTVATLSTRLNRDLIFDKTTFTMCTKNVIETMKKIQPGIFVFLIKFLF